MASSAPLFPQEAFHIPTGVTHVCAAGETAPLRSCQDALTDYLTDKSDGSGGRDRQGHQLDEVRRMVSEEWNVTPGDIGFCSSVAEGVCLVLESLAWEEGDNVCVDANEYPSLVAPFAVRAQRTRGTSTPAPQVRYTTPTTIETTIDKRTKLIAVSYVSYLDGSRVNLAEYRHLADSVGAMLVVDFTQAAGYLPVDASIADFAFSACYKWLLGTTGTALVSWNRARQPKWTPGTAGWHSLAIGVARPQWDSGDVSVRDDGLCFSRGNPGHLSIYILRKGLEFLRQWKTSEIETHVQTMTVRLLQELKKEGVDPSTPEDPKKHGASVTIDCNGASSIVDEMSKAGIYAWNGRGRVRFSFHGYNSMQDVDRILEVFPPLWRKFHCGEK
ncbi:hypothetical protein HK405_006568 [Cladochytrium tenue]|nr:hypothetical protein HK405_006568 [Cladochytrium tenue]